MLVCGDCRDKGLTGLTCPCPRKKPGGASVPLGTLDVQLNWGAGEVLDLSNKTATEVPVPETKKIDPLILMAMRDQTTSKDSERWMFLQHIEALEEEIRELRAAANYQRTVICDALGLSPTEIKTVNGRPLRKVVKIVNPGSPVTDRHKPDHVVLECGHGAWTNEYDYPCDECGPE